MVSPEVSPPPPLATPLSIRVLAVLSGYSYNAVISKLKKLLPNESQSLTFFYFSNDSMPSDFRSNGLPSAYLSFRTASVGNTG